MKMNRLISILLAILLTTSAAMPALALTTAEKEQMYANALSQLEAILESSSEEAWKLDAVVEQFDALENFQNAKKMKYYVSVLIKVRDEEYDSRLDFYLKSMQSDERFVEYLENLEDSSIYTLPELENYVKGREAQHEGDERAALGFYRQCNGFYDSDSRCEELDSKLNAELYETAEELFFDGKLEEAYVLLVSMEGYKDSDEYVAYILDELGYDPLKHVHDWQPATCTAPKTCSGCGNTEGEALGHKWDNGKVTTPATCVSDGVMTYTCMACGEKKNEAISHYGDNHIWQDATCTSPKTCSICGAVEGEALEHKWDNGKLTTKATCISEGVTTYACTMCGTTKNDSTPKDASNHTGGTRVEGAYDATCGSTGYTGDTYCLSCGAKIGNGSSISATGNHNWQPATYDAPKTCRVCGATEGEPLPRVQVGKYITFGHYHQNADGKDVSPIEWLVLDMNENKALVISRYGLDAYHFGGNYYGWENSMVREWLNDNFLNSAFSLSEQTGIIPTVVHTQDNSAWVNYYKDTTGEERSRISGGGDTYDAVFLLSLEETQKYFGCYSLHEKTEILKAVPTAYAVARGATDCSFMGVEFMQDGRGCCYWWLRSPGVKGYDSMGVSYSVSYVDGNGAISNTSGGADYFAVRPAMWVDLDYVMP